MRPIFEPIWWVSWLTILALLIWWAIDEVRRSTVMDRTPYCVVEGCPKQAIGSRPVGMTSDGIPIVELVCEEHESNLQWDETVR